MTTFKVKWEIDVEADTSREAAHRAKQIQLDPSSDNNVFEVIDGIVCQHIDLDDPAPLPAYYLEPITDLDKAKDFLRALQTDGKLFHLEDSPETVVSSRTGERTFTDEEAAHLRLRVDEVFHAFGVHGGKTYQGDPFAFVMDELLGRPPAQ